MLMTVVAITIVIIFPGELSQEAADGYQEIVLRCLSENLGLCLLSPTLGGVGMQGK